MTPDQIVLFSLLFFVFVFLVWGRWRYDLVAFLALLIAVLAGLVPTEKAFSGKTPGSMAFMPWLRRAKLSAEPFIKVLNKTSPSMPARWPMVRASDKA